MSINTINNRKSGGVRWTWEVATPNGIVLVPDTTVGEAVRKAGVAGIEAVTPATAERHALALAASVSV